MNLSLRIGNTRNQYSPASLINSDQTKLTTHRGKMSPANANQDHAVFSTTGKKLNLIINDKDNLSAANRWNPVLNGGQNRNLNTADEYIAKAGTLLEQMLEITEAAKDQSLSVEERLALQTEVGRLQHELNIIGETLSLAPGLGERDYKTHEQYVRNHVLGSYENSLSYRMLKRAADRVAGGGDWDVREIAHRGPWIKNEDGSASDINGIVNGVQEDYFSSDSISISLTKQRLDTDDLSGYVGLVYEVTDDASTPTIGEILKNTGRSVMDVSSAAETAEALKHDLAKLKEQQKQLTEIAQDGNEESNSMGSMLEQSAANFLRKVANVLKSLKRKSYQETEGRGAELIKINNHDGRKGSVFPASPSDESLFKNKKLPEFAPSTVMGSEISE